MSYRLLLFFLLLTNLIGFICSLTFGSYDSNFSELIAWISSRLGAATANSSQIFSIFDLRAERAFLAFACGGLLALAGLLMQTLLRNPLADPYILGLSGGAGIGALLAVYLNLSVFLLNTFAFAGAFIVSLLVLAVASGAGSWNNLRLILAGVIIASGCGAVITFLLVISSPNASQSMLFWLIGDLSNGNSPKYAILLLFFLLLTSYPLARNLNVLTHGYIFAQNLGVNVKVLKLQIYLIAALATAIAVTHAGSIGFVGLVIPHLLRLCSGNEHRWLLALSVLAGGGLLIFADILSRTLFAPIQLPVGVMSAFIGVPIFILLIRNDKYRC